MTLKRVPGTYFTDFAKTPSLLRILLLTLSGRSRDTQHWAEVSLLHQPKLTLFHFRPVSVAVSHKGACILLWTIDLQAYNEPLTQKSPLKQRALHILMTFTIGGSYGRRSLTCITVVTFLPKYVVDHFRSSQAQPSRYPTLT